MATTDVNVPHSVVYCRGTKCHTLATCGVTGTCGYKSSAQEFQEARTKRAVPDVDVELNNKQIEMFDRGEYDIVVKPALSTDSAERKEIPLARGVLDYFPAALAELARLAVEGNRKHNPGEDLHWARGKSLDHADCIMRHLVDRGTVDTDGFLHDVKVAWRGLAQLQEALEARGAPKARGAR